MERQADVRVASGSGVILSNRRPFVLIAGLNVLESRDLAFRVTETLVHATARLGIPFIFKASFDKANRSSAESFRGPGLEEGLRILAGLKETFGVPVLTDIHGSEQAAPVGEVADVLQIPAFLSRQTDLIGAAAATGLPLHVKKMQMMAPHEMGNIVDKCLSFGNDRILLCERGTSFGYGRLMVDPLAFPEMKAFGFPVTFDVTHSLQLPGALGAATGGRGQYVPELALAGLSQGIAGLFLECHPNPEHARCDGPCALPLDRVPGVLSRAKAMDDLVKSWPEPASAKIDDGQSLS
jgi:2-dehydro-3-deoxyphosphooctonate aldolase (KDO 8-P synthase)